MQHTSSDTFRTSRHLSASPAAVFAAIQDPKRLALWWGPKGFRNEFEQFEFQKGGRWIFRMIGPDGTVYPNESVFLEIKPQQQVVIRHDCAPLFTLSISLAPDSSGTQLQWEQVFDDPEIAQAVRHIVEPANEQNLDRLEKILEI